MKRIRLLREGIIALTAFAAACVPSTFDGLSGAKPEGTGGGLHEGDPSQIDPTLAPPRPISPLSTAYVNTDKPHFKWSLAAGTVGATIEVSTTRDFANPVIKAVATGADFTPDDTQKLAAGPYFWRLTGRSATNPGQNQSPIWVVYVRGPGALGASDTPHMTIMDVDGNGHPDLAVMTISKEEGDDDDTGGPLGTGNQPLLWVTTADDSDNYAPYTNQQPWFPYSSAVLLAPVDINGDGYGDIQIADILTAGPNDPPFPPEGMIYPYIGGPAGIAASFNDALEFFQQPFSIMPALTAGDFNGDGYGDVAAAFTDYGAALLGTAAGGGSMMPFLTGAGLPTPQTGPRAIASSDFNGDGINDIAFAPLDMLAPIRFSNGGTAHFDPGSALAFSTTTTPTRASAIGAGDFDGDGIDDIAFTTTFGGKPAVCIHSVADSTFNDKACWTSTTTDAAADFGIALLAADIDGTDGKDEVIVVSKSGLIALAHTGTGKGFTSDDSVFTPTPLVPAIKPATATGVTVIYPGRPGPARWAAYNTDGKSFDVYKGTTSVQHVDLSVDDDDSFISLGATIR